MASCPHWPVARAGILAVAHAKGHTGNEKGEQRD